MTTNKSHYYSGLPPHRVQFEALIGIGLHPSNETPFVLSLDIGGEDIIVQLTTIVVVVPA